MNIGVVGLGKVGLPLALVLRHYGRHNVIGYDLDAERAIRHQTVERRNPQIHPERELRDLLVAGPIAVAPDMNALVRYCDTVIVIVDTPHPPGVDTTDPHFHAGPCDFAYSNLQAAIDEVMGQAVAQAKELTLVITSTVSPGTTWRLTDGHPQLVRIVYSPVMISLGSVVRDLLTPDLVLVGADDPAAAEVVRQMWTPIINSRPVIQLPIVDAELTKLAMNAYISSRIDFANAIARLAEGLGADVDNVLNTVASTRVSGRLANFRAGLSDGGACRPRDLKVLNYLSRQPGAHTAFPLWATLERERVRHTEWLARRAMQEAKQRGLSVVIDGLAYKPEVPYTDGSIGVMMLKLLLEWGVSVTVWDPMVGTLETSTPQPQPAPQPQLAVHVLATPHHAITDWLYKSCPAGSVIIDPWGELNPGILPDGVGLVTPGRRRD